MWNRRPWKEVAEINEWIVGAGASSNALDDSDGSNLDDSKRYLFSRSGPPVELQVWVVPRSSLVATLLGGRLWSLGFSSIFSRMRFRTTWLAIAVIGLLAAVLAPPSVLFLLSRIRGHRRRFDASGASDRGDPYQIEIAVNVGRRAGPPAESTGDGFVADAFA